MHIIYIHIYIIHTHLYTVSYHLGMKMVIPWASVRKGLFRTKAEMYYDEHGTGWGRK